MNTSRPDSSGSLEERPVLNREAPGSTPGQGSTYLYAILRKDLSGGALLAQLGHAVSECLRPEDLPLPKDTRIVVLGASKAQLELVKLKLFEQSLAHAEIVETDGPLVDVTTAIGVVTRDRASLAPILGELRPWR